jgi:hypothetical protein
MAIPGGDTALANADFEGQLAAFMASLRLRESGSRQGNYNARGQMTKHGHAYGAYQFLDKTWRPYGWNRDNPELAAEPYIGSDGVAYYSAKDAPKHIQDERARELIIQSYRGQARGDWGAVAVGWHAGGNAISAYFAGTLNTADANMSTIDYVKDVINNMEGSSNLTSFISNYQEMDDAWELAQDMLADYGLESLFDEVYELVTTGRTPEMAMKLIRDSEAYQNRFKGMAERVANGYAAITPARYVELENNYKSMMSQAGFDPEFIGDDFSEFIANDVNESEFGDRIDVALQAVDAADPLILEELKDRYGIGVDSKADLVMYFLDPERTVNLLEARTQLGVAKLSAATTGTIGGRLETKTAEKLFQRGYSDREVAERLKGRGGFRQRLVGEQKRTKTGGPLSSTELAAAEFGLDSEAVAMVKNLTAQRRQRGVSTAGAAMTSGGVMGFGRAT